MPDSDLKKNSIVTVPLYRSKVKKEGSGTLNHVGQ